MRPDAPPKITIITPTYNQAGYIRDCIRSIQDQRFGDYEHLIYDALSKDGTAEVVESFLTDPRIVYRRERDEGAADAINKGLEAATGDIVCWLNSDDAYFDPKVLARVVELFEDHPDVQVVTGCGYFMAENGRLISPCVMPDAARIGHDGMRRSDYFLQPATFWRRNALRLDASLGFCFDWKLFLDFYESGFSVLYVPEYFAKYRLQPASKTVLDGAARRGEVVRMLRYGGAPPAQIAWARFIHLCYRVSERTGFPGLRRSTRTLNTAAHFLTAGRIFSP
jgi:glycosyltransferase involved in cell wall biosynthesis